MRPRSHFTTTLNTGETIHVFNPNTSDAIDERHILSPIHDICPLCQKYPEPLSFNEEAEREEAERAAEECDACGCIMDAHDKIDAYGSRLQVTCDANLGGCNDCGEAGDAERHEALGEKVYAMCKAVEYACDNRPRYQPHMLYHM